MSYPVGKIQAREVCRSVSHSLVMLFSGIIFLSSTCKEPSSGADLKYIHCGYSSGRCRGDCFHEVYFEPGLVTHISKAHYDYDPLKTSDTAVLSKVTWDSLVTSFSLSAFAALPEKIGCPGCGDKPIRWVEIRYGSKMHRVNYENDQDVEMLKSLLKIVQRYNR
jgi:hypothetical protein